MKKWISLLALGLFGIMIVLASCTPTGTPSENDISTMVAATVMAAGGSTSSPESPTSTSELPTITASPAPIRVSFVSSSRNLYVWTDGSGVPVQLTTSNDVSQSFISSDGSLIAFIRNSDYTHYQLDVINADGTNQRTLLSIDQIAALPRPSGSLGLQPGQVAWIPNTHTIALNFRVLYEGPGLAFAAPLYMLDAETGGLTTLLSVDESWAFKYSPDASKVLISRATGVDLYNADGSLIVANVVSHGFVNTASEYAWTSKPVWKNDSSAFAVAIAPEQPWGDTAEPSHIHAFSNTGVSIPSPISGVMMFSSELATFRPDLGRVAYTTRVGAAADNTWALHIANLDGTNDSIVATGYFNQLPVWSPDGTFFIFALRVGDSVQTYLNMDGGISMLLPGVPLLIDIRWIDNTRYVVSTKSGTANSLLMGTTTGVLSVIYNNPGSTDNLTLNFDVNR